MNNTAKQLVEQLGDNQKITIMADVVHGLDFEYRQLQQKYIYFKKQNDEWKNLAIKQTHDLEIKDNILTEFEKWLKKELFDKTQIHFQYSLALRKCFDKLQELKEGKK